MTSFANLEFLKQNNPRAMIPNFKSEKSCFEKFFLLNRFKHKKNEPKIKKGGEDFEKIG